MFREEPTIVNFVYSDPLTRRQRIYGEIDKYVYKHDEIVGRGFRQGLIGAVRMVFLTPRNYVLLPSQEDLAINYTLGGQIRPCPYGYVIGFHDENIIVPNGINSLENPFRPSQMLIQQMAHAYFTSGENPFKRKELSGIDFCDIGHPLRITIDHKNRRHGYSSTEAYLYPIVDKLTRIVLQCCLMPGTSEMDREIINRHLCNIDIGSLTIQSKQISEKQEKAKNYWGNNVRHTIESRGGGKNVRLGIKGKADLASYALTYSSSVRLKDPKIQEQLAALTIPVREHMKIFWVEGGIMVSCSDYNLVKHIRDSYHYEGFKFDHLKHPVPLPPDYTQLAQLSAF